MIVAAPAIKRVPPISAVDRIVARAAGDQIVAAAPVDRVVAEPALQHVVARRTRYRLIGQRRDDLDAIAEIFEICLRQLASVDRFEPKEFHLRRQAPNVGLEIDDDIGAVLLQEYLIRDCGSLARIAPSPSPPPFGILMMSPPSPALKSVTMFCSV